MCAVKSNCIRTQQPTKHYTYNTTDDNSSNALSKREIRSNNCHKPKPNETFTQLQSNRQNKLRCAHINFNSTNINGFLYFAFVFVFLLPCNFVYFSIRTALFSVGIISLKKIGCVITYYFHLLNTNTDSNWLR